MINFDGAVMDLVTLLLCIGTAILVLAGFLWYRAYRFVKEQIK